jgi:hypothetical protein
LNRIEHDINVLNKILNSPIILEKYPYIREVSVYQFYNHIDIVFFLDEKNPAGTHPYFLNINEIYSKVHDLAAMAGVKTHFKIYP